MDDKKNPFVINKLDYVDRYVRAVMKDYQLGVQTTSDELDVSWFNKKLLSEFLNATSNYVDDMATLVDHYKINDRLLEMIYEEFAGFGIEAKAENISVMMQRLNIQSLMNRIGTEFKELYYDEDRNLIIGAIDAKQQVVEISEQLIKRGLPIIGLMEEWLPKGDSQLVLKSTKTATEYRLSLLGIMKILKKYQPNILHRFKGLTELDLTALNCGKSLRAYPTAVFQ